jgi:hypothetical protein
MIAEIIGHALLLYMIVGIGINIIDLIADFIFPQEIRRIK